MTSATEIPNGVVLTPPPRSASKPTAGAAREALRIALSGLAIKGLGLILPADMMDGNLQLVVFTVVAMFLAWAGKKLRTYGIVIGEAFALLLAVFVFSGCVGRADYKSPMLTFGLGNINSSTCDGTATLIPATETEPGKLVCEGRLISTQGAHEGENAMKTIDGFWTAVSSALKFLAPAGLVP